MSDRWTTDESQCGTELILGLISDTLPAWMTSSSCWSSIASPVSKPNPWLSLGARRWGMWALCTSWLTFFVNSSDGLSAGWTKRILRNPSSTSYDTQVHPEFWFRGTPPKHDENMMMHECDVAHHRDSIISDSHTQSRCEQIRIHVIRRQMTQRSVWCFVCTCTRSR